MSLPGPDGPGRVNMPAHPERPCSAPTVGSGGLKRPVRPDGSAGPAAPVPTRAAPRPSRAMPWARRASAPLRPGRAVRKFPSPTYGPSNRKIKCTQLKMEQLLRNASCVVD